MSVDASPIWAPSTIRSRYPTDRVIVAGKLPAKKHGRSTFILRGEIERYIGTWPEVKPRLVR